MKLGKTYAQGFVELCQAWGAIHGYYAGTHEYKLDDFAKAPQLHNDLLAAYKKYLEKRSNAFIAYEKFFDEMHTEQKAALKAKGSIIRYNLLDSMDIAQEIMADLGQAFSANGDLTAIDKASFGEKITRFEVVTNQLRILKGDEKALAKEGVKAMYFDSYVDSLAS